MIKNVEVVNRGKVDYCDYITLENGDLSVNVIGDNHINDGEGYNGVSICGNANICNSDISKFGGYGIITTNGYSDIKYSDIKDRDGNVVLGVSYRNLEILDSQHIHLIKNIDISNFKQFELGYTFGYMGYNYINCREYISKFYDSTNNLIEELKCKQYDKVKVPDGSKFVDFVFKQDKVPTSGNEDFGGSVLFISNYTCPKIEIRDCFIHDNTRENIAICGGQNVLVKGNRLENTWIGLVIEDGWELCKDVIITENDFKNNGRDVIVASGRNLDFNNNIFSSWVNIGNRVEGLKFNNNTFDITEENHKKTNDRFVVEVHKDNVEICDNKFKNARVQLVSDDYAKSGNANVIMKRNVFENTPITVMDKLFICEDSEIKGNTERLVGKFINCNWHSYELDVVGIDIENSLIHSIPRAKFQKYNIIKKSNISDCNFEILNDYKDTSLTIKDSNINNVSFSITGRSLNLTSFIVEDCKIDINKPLIDMYNCTGNGNYIFKNCEIIGSDVEYLCKATWSDNDYSNYKIIFENCTIKGFKNISNQKIKNHVFIKD